MSDHCHEFIDTGRCGHSDTEHDAIADAAMSHDHREAIAEVLAAHGPSGFVNSREGWVECECDEKLHLPSGLTFDGYPEMWEEERKARNVHLADALLGSDVLAQIRAEARAEALREVADGIESQSPEMSFRDADLYFRFADFLRRRAALTTEGSV